MQAKEFNIRGLFESGIQYVIPRYQRHYVWNKDAQWAPLWEDIESIAEYVVKHNAPPHPHFTGAIVTQGELPTLGAPPTFEVIDGQQRLITFQIVLCAIRDACEKQFPDIAADAQRLIRNSGTEAKGEGKFKLLPGKLDRSAFKSMVESGGGEGVIIKAYDFFKRKSEEFIAEDAGKAAVLFVAIRDGFNIVQIEVESRDEPETIFQSLNGKGRHLWQFDLLRNDLFLRMRQTMTDRKDELYEQYWEGFESSEWEKSVGRQNAMPLAELFLQHFLAAKSVKATVSALFPGYRKYRTSTRRDLKVEGEVEGELRELRRCADLYHGIVSNEAPGEEMAMYKILDITVFRPFILYVMADSKLSEKQRKHVFCALESYVVRRFLGEKYPTTRSNLFFADIIKELRGVNYPILDEQVAMEQVLNQLNSKSSSETERWPSNKNMESQRSLSGGWGELNHNKDNRVARYVLYKIEQRMREKSRDVSGSPPLFRDMTLEHVLPQKWWQRWDLPVGRERVKREEMFSEQYKRDKEWRTQCPEEGQEEYALKDMAYMGALAVARDRDRLLNSFGNLTLVGPEFNRDLSNYPFSIKKKAIKEHALLMLHKDICEEQEWDVAQIQQREARMREIFNEIWPDAQWFLNNIPSE